jgi:hypothetical protein
MCAALLAGGGAAWAADMSYPSGQAKMPAAQSAMPAKQAPQQATLPPSGDTTHWTARNDNGRATEALNALEEHGYGQFSDFHRQGDGYEATVSQNGKSTNVYVDPQSDTVTQKD